MSRIVITTAAVPGFRLSKGDIIEADAVLGATLGNNARTPLFRDTLGESAAVSTPAPDRERAR